MHDKEIVASMTNYAKDKFSRLITDDEPFLVQSCVYTVTETVMKLTNNVGCLYFYLFSNF